MIGRKVSLILEAQRGFTLIEALIAFVVLTVGLLGASLFHSTLLSEFTESKAEYNATKVAETQIEKIRQVLAGVSDASAVYLNLTGAVSSPMTLNGYEYSVSVANYSGPSSSGLLSFDLQLSWNGREGARTVSIPQYVAWNLGSLALPEDVSLKPSQNSYGGTIPLPLGTLDRLNRDAIALTDLASSELVSGDTSGTGAVYKGSIDGDLVAGVQVGNEFVKLVGLSSSDNEIFRISGRIFLDKVKPVKVQGSTLLDFGCAFNPSETSALCPLGTVDDDVLDVAATGGAGCLIYEIDTSNSNYSVGKYVCLAGTGWNGQIQPYVLDKQTGGNGTDSVTPINGQVCSPSQRGFRYLIIDPTKVTDFEDKFVSSSVPSYELFNEASGAIVGQSGLVRFYQAGDPNISSEGVTLESYFWLNPHYIVQPSVSSTSYDYGYDVYGGELRDEPGNVAYQDYYIHGKKTGSIYVDCSTYGLPEYAVATNGGGYDNPYYSYGMPGYNYRPFASSAYPIEMYNREYTNYSALVLGYTLSRYSVAGSLSFPDTYNYDDFVLGGNPEPVISINCERDASTLETNGGFSKIDYECAVPTGWSGSILSYLANPAKNKVGDVTMADTVFSSLDSKNICDEPSSATVAYDSVSNEDTVDPLIGAYQLYWKALGSPSAADTSYDFTGLGLVQIETEITESLSDQDISFYSSCP